MLQSAVEQNYCAHSNLQQDPLLVKLRGDPGFAKLVEAAASCQQAMVGAGQAGQQ
jgi:hypothetical protein